MHEYKNVSSSDIELYRFCAKGATYDNVEHAFDTSVFSVVFQGRDVHSMQVTMISDDKDFGVYVAQFLRALGFEEFKEGFQSTLRIALPSSSDGAAREFQFSPYQKHCVQFAPTEDFSVGYRIQSHSVSYDLFGFAEVKFYVLIVLGLSLFLFGADVIATSTPLHYVVSTIGISIMFGFLTAYVIVSKLFPKPVAGVLQAGILAAYFGIGFSFRTHLESLARDNAQIAAYVLAALVGLSFALTHVVVVPRLKDRRVQDLIRWAVDLVALTCVGFSTRSPTYAMIFVFATVVSPLLFSGTIGNLRRGPSVKQFTDVESEAKKPRGSYSTAAAGAKRVAAVAAAAAPPASPKRPKSKTKSRPRSPVAVAQEINRRRIDERVQARVKLLQESAKKKKRKSPAKRRIGVSSTSAAPPARVKKDAVDDDGDDFESRVMSMKVKELKSMLSERSLPVSGRKADLQKRLLDDWSGSSAAGVVSASSSSSSGRKKRKTAPKRKKKAATASKSPAKKAKRAAKTKKKGLSVVDEAKKRKLEQLKRRLEIRAETLLSPVKERKAKRTRRSTRRG